MCTSVLLFPSDLPWKGGLRSFGIDSPPELGLASPWETQSFGSLTSRLSGGGGSWAAGWTPVDTLVWRLGLEVGLPVTRKHIHRPYLPLETELPVSMWRHQGRQPGAMATSGSFGSPQTFREVSLSPLSQESCHICVPPAVTK